MSDLYTIKTVFADVQISVGLNIKKTNSYFFPELKK